MTASQYKNIVEWSYRLHPELSKMNDLAAIRKIFDNLGVAFPKGTLSDALPILESNTFLGWTSCNYEEAYEFANVGIPSIKMDEKHIILIIPSSQTPSLTDLSSDTIPSSAPVRSADEMKTEENSNMHFFAYSYRRKLEQKT